MQLGTKTFLHLIINFNTNHYPKSFTNVVSQRLTLIDPGGTWTHNPQLRRLMPYPLGHWVITWKISKASFCVFAMSVSRCVMSFFACTFCPVAVIFDNTEALPSKCYYAANYCTYKRLLMHQTAEVCIWTEASDLAIVKGSIKCSLWKIKYLCNKYPSLDKICQCLTCPYCSFGFF